MSLKDCRVYQHHGEQIRGYISTHNFDDIFVGDRVVELVEVTSEVEDIQGLVEGDVGLLLSYR